MNSRVLPIACILTALSLTCSIAGAQDPEQAVDDAYTGLSQVALPSELSFVSPDYKRIIVPQGTYEVTSPDGVNLRLTGSNADALLKAELGRHQEAITFSSVVLITEAGVTHVVMLLPNGTTLDAAGFPASLSTRETTRVLTPQQIGSSEQTMLSLQRVYQIASASDEAEELLEHGLQSASAVAAMPTQLYRATHFVDSAGNPVMLSAGAYKVERRDASSLALVAADGSEKVISAEQSRHDIDLRAPAALSVAAGKDEHHLLLLQPDGTSLDAAGTYTGTTRRGTLAVASPKLSSERVSTSYRYQLNLRYQQLKAGRVLQRGDLQITSVAHMGPTPHLVNNPDVPIPDNLSQQTKVLDYGPNEGTVVLPRTRYAKATVTNAGTYRVVLPDQFRYLGGASYSQHRDGNIVVGETSLGAGESRIIELGLKNECPRAPQLTTGAGYGYGLVVDPQAKLAETNESNNAWAKAVYNPYASNQYPMADLVIDRVFFTANTSFRGDIDMHVVIRNQGSRRAVICAPLASGGDVLWKSNNPLSAYTTDNNFDVKEYSYHLLLEPGQIWDSVRHRVNSYRIPGGSSYYKEITSGCYSFSVEINPNGTIPESESSNNKATAYYRTDASVSCRQQAATLKQSVLLQQSSESNLSRFILKREAESPEVQSRGVSRAVDRVWLSPTVRASLVRPDAELQDAALRELVPADRRRLDSIVRQLKSGNLQSAQREWETAVSILAKRQSHAPVDLEAVIQWVLRQSYVNSGGALTDYAKKVQYFNQVQSSIRQQLAETRRDRYELQRTNSPAVLSSSYRLQSVIVTRSDAATLENNIESRAVSSVSELESYIDSLEAQLHTIGEDAQLANIDLQDVLQKQQQTIQVLSNVSKMLHDTAMAVIRKIG
jgi:hypothetical protein